VIIPFKKLAEKADEIFASAIAGEVLGGSEAVVRALQKAGPQWSGEFGNSWVIKTQSNQSQPSRRRGGDPKSDPVRAPLVTGKEISSKNTWLIRIENVAPHAAIAMDLEEGKFNRDWYPSGPVNPAKWKQGGGSRAGVMRRGVTDSFGKGTASKTAPLDWFSTFKSGGKVDQIIKKYMGMKLNVPTNYTFLTSETYRTRGVSD
tara:strand:- start:78 stop:686 length:609 start_codon:yes stop_codon:yes gene_type:complete